MGILDISAEQMVNAAASMEPPRIPQPKPGPSAWSSVWRTVNAPARGVTSAAAEAGASLAETIGGFGQVLGAYPEAFGYIPTGEARRQADDARAKLLREGVSMNNDIGDSLRRAGASYRPDPETSNVAEQVLYGFARGASKVVGGAVAGGPIGIGFAAMEEANTQADELQQQGVPFVPRVAAGGVQGLGLGLAALPLVGTSLGQTAALYLAGGPGGFIAQQALTREILQNAGQEKVAMQFDPFDPVGLSVATLLPAAFTAYGLRGQRLQRAADSLPPDLATAEGRAPAAAAPDVPPPAAPIPSDLSPVARAARSYPTEAVDAAMVVHLAEQRARSNPVGDAAPMRAADQHAAALARAEEQIAAGEAVRVTDVAPDPVITPAQRDANFAAWFGDSKVVDAEGKPLVVYHGTTADVPEFSLDASGADGVKYSVPAIFGTTDVKLANDYAVNKMDRVIADAMRAMEVFKNKNPGDYGDGYETLYAAVKASFKRVQEEGRAETGGGANVVPLFVSLKNPLVVDGKGGRFMAVMPEAIARAVADGHDGMIVNNVIDHASPATDYPSQVVVAFRPEQVKSAIGNSGRFDPNSPSLTDPLTEFATTLRAGLDQMRAEMEAQGMPARAPATEPNRPGAAPDAPVTQPGTDAQTTRAATPTAEAPPPAGTGAAAAADVPGARGAAAEAGRVTDAEAEAQLWDKVRNDFDAAVAEYAALPDSGGGKILNTDTARELSPVYLADRTRSAAVHEPASQFVKDLYARKLAEAPGPGESPLVLFTAGGTGAGKTSALAGLPSLSPLVDQAQIVYDTNMNGYASSRQKVTQALEAGKNVTIVLVARDPVDALVNGALPRAENQRKKFGTGRTVPIGEHIKTHLGAVETVNRLAAEFADHPQVTIRVVDNSLGKGKAEEKTTAWLADLRYNDVEQRVRAALESEYAAGRISAETYRGFAGQAAAAAGDQAVAGGAGQDRRVQPADRVGLREGPEPAGPQGGLSAGPAGAETSAITERGLNVPLRYRLAEAGDLTTSHTNALTPNPAFPAELQPRDRARAASAEQISRIENAIRPELLGESAKASDGAPIVGPDAVVESGNARTIALRRAYEGGKADAYRAWLADNAERFGLTRQQVEDMRQPVLVRERLGTIDRAEFARQANESAVAAMSPTEQAMGDARRINDLTGLVANDDGTINTTQSAAFIRQFVQQAVAPTERGGMLQANGQLSQAGLSRLRNAVFAKAYGDPEILAMLTESTDANVRNILAGMLRAAPEVAKLADLAEAGARQNVDIAGPLVEAVRLFSQLRSEGRTVQQFLAQGSMFGDGVKPEVAAMLEAVSLNARAPKRIAEMITGMVDNVNALGDTRQAGMFGDAPTGAEAVAEAAAQAVTSTRLALAQEKFPGLEVMLDGMDKPVPVAEFLASVQREAATEKAGAPDLMTAATCALLNGAA